MIIIIGAGISGLTAVNNLDMHNRCIILEKENYIGGLSTQYLSNGYWFDFGGHYFHFQGKEDIKEYLIDFCRFKEFTRKSRTFLLGRYIPFPVQLHLSYLPSPLKGKIFKEILNNKIIGTDNLHDFLETHFGNTLFRLFFDPFLTKYYRVDLRTLAADMDKGSIPMPDKERVAEGFKGKRFLKTGYNPVFYYPRSSLRHFIKTYAGNIRERIRLNEEVIEIDSERNILRTRDKTFQYDALVNTMPLKHLLKIIKPRGKFLSPGKLRHISTLVVNVVLKRKRKRFHWVYLPERKFPFYRAGFYPVHRFPVCYLEKTVPLDAPMDKDILYREILFTLKELKVVEKKEDIVYFDPRLIPVSYVLFTKDWRTAVPGVLKELEKCNIYSIGRYGSWNYTSMSDDVKSALSCARTIKEKVLKRR